MQTEVREQLRVLDFDIENRPLSYLGSDWTSAEITAIAWSWLGAERVECLALGQVTPQAMLLNFRIAYEQADVVTGHYIRKHDLPIINGALLEFDLPLLDEKLSSDTKLDLVRRKDLSASQESLAAMYGLPEAKHHMSQQEWRTANRLTDEGIEATRKRVIDDVVQHKALRERLIAADALGRPRVWRP